MDDADSKHLSIGCGCLLIAAPLFVIFLIIDIFWGAQLGIYSTGDSGPRVTTPPTATSTFTAMPQLFDDPSQPDWMVQGDWYCWDTGPLRPHYIGHHVPGDHLCTWGELRADGFAVEP